MGYTFTRETNHMLDSDYRNYIVMSKSNHSYAINNQIVTKLNSRSWAGRRCFIIGGGESLKGFDFSRLNNELTIGINKSFECYPKATINYSMDVAFYNKLQQGQFKDINGNNLWDRWVDFQGIRVFLTPMGKKEFGKELYLVRREWKPIINKQNLDNGIYGGANSGVGAINLAISLGSTEIYLLGYDLKCVAQTHWHNGYEPRELEKFNKKLKEYCVEITKLFASAKSVGVNIYNSNLNSALKCFPYFDINKKLGGN